MLKQAFFATFAACLATVLAAHAADYPTRPVSFIVPYAAGGIVDLTARLLAERLGPSLVVSCQSSRAPEPTRGHSRCRACSRIKLS